MSARGEGVFLKVALAGVEVKVAREIVWAFAARQGPDSLKQLARACGLSSRHMRRVLADGGVVSSHRFFAARRVLRAWDDVARGMALSEVAQRYGFGTVRTLRSQWLSVSGDDASVTAARRAPVSDAAIERIAALVVIKET